MRLRPVCSIKNASFGLATDKPNGAYITPRDFKEVCYAVTLFPAVQ